MPRPTQDQSRKALPSSAKRKLQFGDQREDDDAARRGRKDEENDIVPPDDEQPSVIFLGETPTKKRKHSLPDFFSSAASDGASAIVVTPEKSEPSATSTTTLTATSKPKNDDVGETKKGDDRYVPRYIHKNLNYQGRGLASTSATLRTTFALVEQHYRLPSDLETNRVYGPLSGTCYEERAVEAYNLGLLEPREGASGGNEATATSSATVSICCHCAVLGHKRDDCPDLI